MEKKLQWLSTLKNELSNSPLVSNAAFGFILMVLEKLVELEFECPCNPKWNGIFSSGFFVIPAVMAFVLMLIIQGCRCGMHKPKSLSISSFVPAVVWLIILFLDGQYYACAMTDWEGTFVTAAPQKWCAPTNESDIQKLMRRTQGLFVVSQVIGMGLLILICVGLIMYLIKESCKKEEEKKEEVNNYEMTERSQQL